MLAVLAEDDAHAFFDTDPCIPARHKVMPAVLAHLQAKVDRDAHAESHRHVLRHPHVAVRKVRCRRKALFCLLKIDLDILLRKRPLPNRPFFDARGA